jgi:hypothetical protein
MKEKRTTFHGDDEDYQYPYYHRYNEPDSDRGGSDEHQTSNDYQAHFDNFYNNGKD